MIIKIVNYAFITLAAIIVGTSVYAISKDDRLKDPYSSIFCLIVIAVGVVCVSYARATFSIKVKAAIIIAALLYFFLQKPIEKN